MEFASEIMPIILYFLLSILVVISIVFIYKLTKTLEKANVVLDDVYIKIKKLDNLFNVIDRSADAINAVTDKVTNTIANVVMKLFKRKRKDDIDE